MTSGPIHLLRHAKAGHRSSWTGPDEERPLSPRGRRQVRALIEAFEGIELARIGTSPFVRCVETVAELAAARGIALEVMPELAEGHDLDEVWAFVRSLDERPTLLCGHGPEISDVMRRVAESGARVDGHGLAKGSVWVLERDGGRIVAGSYRPAPSG